jgi:hypothetical protein
LPDRSTDLMPPAILQHPATVTLAITGAAAATAALLTQVTVSWLQHDAGILPAVFSAIVAALSVPLAVYPRARALRLAAKGDGEGRADPPRDASRS